MHTPKKTGRTKQAKINKAIEAIELPEIGQTTYQLIGKHILFINIEHDQDAFNPCKDQDGLGFVRSFSTRHIDHIDPDEAREMMEADSDIIPLSYFEHGNSLWMVCGEERPGVEFQWDGVRFAGIWIPDASVRESYTAQDGLSRKEWMRKQAAACCETYTDWCNGNVYGYTVQLHKARYTEDGQLFDDWNDYRFKKAIEDDSCWGFYGWEYFTGEVKDIVKGMITRAIK
jgi:hypothetical protein